ncbi:MAG TPA: helicase C-terminal domain-containing protein [Bacteroidota bacterium]
MQPLRNLLKTIFSEDGKLTSLPGYEFRPQQLAMAEAIAAALEGKRHLMVEAPTGVGKSLAYLIPAIVFAKRERRKAIISTHTKNLQEQLLRKDVAIVRSLIDQPIDAVLLKGRGNYVCTTRLESALRQPRLFDSTEYDDIQRIKEWTVKTGDGDLENLGFVPAPGVRQLICSEKGVCSPSTCTSDCFFQKARSRARNADVVVMNHALFFTLFAMLESDEFLLYKNDFVIFDEAHTLEQVAGEGIGKSLSHAQVLYAIHRLYHPKTKRGLFGRLRAKRYRSLCEQAEYSADSFFDEVRDVLRNLGNGSTTLRIRSPFFVNDRLTPDLQGLLSAVQEVEDDKKLNIGKEDLEGAKRLLWEAGILISEFLAQSNKALTYWVESSGGRSANAYLHAAPTDIAESVGSKLFKEGISVIMTGATLSVDGSLGYFQNRIGAKGTESLVLDSPFDHQRQMRIVLAPEIPPPDDRRFEEELPDYVYRSIIRSRGKALVLFTSTRMLQATSQVLRPRMESEGLKLFVQGGTTGRHELLEQFKADIHSVLFGLDSFWMGVDVPGEALEHVIITKLPFAVPDHPLVESRMELIAERGGNAFVDYTLPEAVLKFKQGVGRLIRSKTDRGIVTILDSRMLRKSYGRVFLQSLPRCPVEMLMADGTIQDFEEQGS